MKGVREGVWQSPPSRLESSGGFRRFFIDDSFSFCRYGCELQPKSQTANTQSRCRLTGPALYLAGMPRHLPNALTLAFNRLALIPLQLKREATLAQEAQTEGALTFPQTSA